MSEQMTKDWIEQEYDIWKRGLIHTLNNEVALDRSQYIARSFAFYILKKVSQNTGSGNKGGKNGS